MSFKIGSKYKTKAMGIVTIVGYQSGRTWNGAYVPYLAKTENGDEISYTPDGKAYPFNYSEKFEITGPEPEPVDYKVKFPIGSQWKLRNGERGVVVGYRQSKVAPIIVYNENFVSGSYLVNQHGVYGHQEDYNLIEPWVEPKTGTIWVNIYDNDTTTDHSNREYADLRASQITSKKRLACVEVKWTEGEGLDKTKGSSS